MNKNLKKILVTGASLLVLASVGAGVNQLGSIHAMGKGPCITTEREYREVKHAKGVPYTNLGPRRIKHLKAWGDNETVGYVYGHKVLFGNNGGIILRIDGRHPTYRMAKAVFHEYGHHARRHARKHVARHHARKHSRKNHRRSRK